MINETDSGVRYTREEGMQIAREFSDKLLVQVDRNDLRLIALSGSLSFQSTGVDIDIAVVGRRGFLENSNHIIYELAGAYKKQGIDLDVIPLFPRFVADFSFMQDLKGETREAVRYFYRSISLRHLKRAVPLYENPAGYCDRLKRRFQSQFDRVGVC